MLSETVSDEALALILDGESYSADEICSQLKALFSSEGLSPWQCFDADVYTYGGRTLVLAYPTPPMRERVGNAVIRLSRG